MGKCIFNENWLQKDRYKHWLHRDSNNHKARCRLCSKSFDIGNMGESALVSHLKGIKHRQLEKSQTGSSVSNPTVKELFCSDTTNPGNKTKDSRPSTSTVKNIKYQQRHLCIKVLEKDFSSPGKVLEKSLNFILENLYEPCITY